MAPGKAFRDRWTDALYASKLTIAQRDTLNAYALFIGRDGTIEVQRRVIEEMTRRDTRAIQRHIAAAVSAGLLEVVDRPSPGRPAGYRATLPPAANGWY